VYNIKGCAAVPIARRGDVARGLTPSWRWGISARGPRRTSNVLLEVSVQNATPRIMYLETVRLESPPHYVASDLNGVQGTAGTKGASTPKARQTTPYAWLITPAEHVWCHGLARGCGSRPAPRWAGVPGAQGHAAVPVQAHPH